MNIWVSRLYGASKAKMLKKSSYNLNFPWKYLISELTSLKSLSEYFKNSSGPNFGRMQMKQSDPVPVKWQFCWHSGLESSNSHYVMQCHLEPWHTNQFKLGCTEQFQWQKLYSCLCLQISFQCSRFFSKRPCFCIIVDVHKINILVLMEKELELPKEFRLNSGVSWLFTLSLMTQSAVQSMHCTQSSQKATMYTQPEVVVTQCYPAVTTHWSHGFKSHAKQRERKCKRTAELLSLSVKDIFL